jgi:hypothetical protein
MLNLSVSHVKDTNAGGVGVLIIQAGVMTLL